jgi:hypothetical protein
MKLTVEEFRKICHLETSSFTKFVKWVFTNLQPAKLWSRELAKISNLEPAKLRSREPVKIWTLNLRSSWGREPVKTWSHKSAKPWNRESAEFGNPLKFEFGSRGVWRFPEWGDSRISKKLSQRCCLKKSGFCVWTSGKLVNIWDVKDIHVCVHIRNIPWIRRYFRNVKIPSSPYKRGREGMCKRIHNFWGLSSL